MFIRFEDNPNTGFVDDRVFTARSEPREVTHVLRLLQGQEQWSLVTGLGPGAEAVPAMACKVEDSGEGTCYLLYGGLWGLRLKKSEDSKPWSLDDAEQYGEPFLLLPSDGADLRFR